MSEEEGSGLEYVESDGSGSEFEATSDALSDDDGDDDAPLRGAASSGRATRTAKNAKFMELDSDAEDLLDAEDELAGEDLALIAGAAENDDEEAADLEAAMKASLAITPSIASGRGKTGAPQNSRASMAALRALAAEKRAGTSQKVDDSQAWGSDSEPEAELSSDNLDDSEDSDAGKTKKGKAAKKGKGKASSKAPAATGGKKYQTLAQMRAQRREEKLLAKIAAAPIKHEERLKKKELGRNLTHVSLTPLSSRSRVADVTTNRQAEKTTVALYFYHPELRTVWGDLEEDIPIHKPERSPQPPGFKATLLPFQQESVSWMRKQENGPWAGGVLADEMG